MGILDDLLETIKSGQWTEGKPGDVIESGLEALSRAAPFKSAFKALGGERDPNKLGDLLNPVPEIISDPIGRGIEGLRKANPNLGKLAEDTLINAPFLPHTPGMLKPAEGLTPTLDSVLGPIKSQRGAIDISKEAPSRLVGPGRIETIEGVTRPTSPIETPSIDSPSASKVQRWLDSNQADRVLTQGEEAKAIIRSAAGQRDLNRFQEVGYDSFIEAKNKVSQLLGLKDKVESTSFLQDINKWYKADPERQIQAIRRIESKPRNINELIDIPPEDRPLIDRLSNGQIERENKIRDAGNYGSYIKNYMTHMFAETDKVESLFDRYMVNKKISQGKSYTPPPMLELLDEALNNGYKLKTSNPIEYSLARNADMDRFLLGDEIKNKFMDRGLIMEAGTSPIPAGWKELEGRMFGLERYFAPADVAKNFNRYFSPGLAGGPFGPVMDVMRGFSNALNTAQLGLSGFHLVTESFDAIVSDMALASQQFTRGNYGEAGKAAARSLSVVGSPLNDVIVGSRMLQEGLRPGSYSQYAREVQAVADSGGKFQMDPYYLNQSVRHFQKAIADGRFDKALMHSLPAIMEMTSKPIMEWYVPRIKLGAFQRLSAMIAEDGEKGGWSELQKKAAQQHTWDVVDHRLGQLVQSNLFWNKAVKDLMNVSMRAFGWNYGTINVAGGGILDLTKQSGRLVAQGKFDLTHQMAYGLALPVMAGYTGGLTHFFMTGQIPQKPVDYFFPGDGTYDANGNMNRLNAFGYIKDILHMGTHPLQMAINKLSPAITMIVDLFNNHDFYNTEIIHPGDPLKDKGVDLAKYLASELSSFSVRNYQKKAAMDQAGGMKDFIQSFLFPPANREFIKTPAENLASDFLKSHLPTGPISEVEKEKRNTKNEIEGSYRRGIIGVKELIEAVGKGRITQGQMKSIIKYKTLPTLARDIQMLKPDEAYKVYQAADPREKTLIAASVRKLLYTELRKTSDPDKRKEIANKMLGMAGKIATDEEDDLTY